MKDILRAIFISASLIGIFCYLLSGCASNEVLTEEERQEYEHQRMSKGMR